MLRRVPRTTASYVSWTPALIVLSFAIFAGSICQAASSMPTPTSWLVVLAARKFPNLSDAERAMLWFSSIDNVDRAEFAIAGTSSVPDDPSNDPAHADEWPASRQIRASLIRWICVDHEARNLIDPRASASSARASQADSICRWSTCRVQSCCATAYSARS